ncbi:TPA: hypothetical protein ACLAVB_001873 [Neisseria meningitidis]
METFRFQRSEETFHCRIVQAVSLAGHTLNQTVVFQLLLINIMDMPFQIGIFVFCRLDNQLVMKVPRGSPTITNSSSTDGIALTLRRVAFFLPHFFPID